MGIFKVGDGGGGELLLPSFPGLLSLVGLVGLVDFDRLVFLMAPSPQ